MSASTRSLTDRYLDAIARRLPAAQRTDTVTNIRATLDDDVTARVAAGSTLDAAEHEAVAALGDPDRIAAVHAGRPLHLIGPALFLDWWRLLRLLLLVVLPTVAAVLVVTQAWAGIPILTIVLETTATVLSVGFGLAFWVTLIFAIIERTRTDTGPLTTWSPDDLPAEQSKPDVGIGDLIGGIVAVVLLVGGIIWQATASPFVDAEGELVTFLAAELWPWWINFFVAVVVGELIFAIVLYRQRRWTATMATVNVVLNAAFVVPFVTLLMRDEIVNPAFSAEFAGTGMVELGQQAMFWVALAVSLIATADSVDGVVKAVRARR